MATGAGGFTFDIRDERKLEDLYQGGVTGYNPDIQNNLNYYSQLELDLKWLKNSNNVLHQEKKELQIELKVYKKIIKNLLKKK